MKPADDDEPDTPRVPPADNVPTPTSTAVMAVGAPYAIMWRTRRAGSAAGFTTPGAVRVLAWLFGVMLIGVGGNAIAPALGGWWYVIGLALMMVFTAWWIRRRRSSSLRSEQIQSS